MGAVRYRHTAAGSGRFRSPVGSHRSVRKASPRSTTDKCGQSNRGTRYEVACHAGRNRPPARAKRCRSARNDGRSVRGDLPRLPRSRDARRGRRYRLHVLPRLQVPRRRHRRRGRGSRRGRSADVGRTTRRERRRAQAVHLAHAERDHRHLTDRLDLRDTVVRRGGTRGGKRGLRGAGHRLSVRLGVRVPERLHGERGTSRPPGRADRSHGDFPGRLA